MTTDPLARTFHALPKCTIHPGALLTSEGACPMCERAANPTSPEKPDTKHIPRPPNRKAREASRLQAQTRVVSGDRRRNVSAAEAARLGAA